MIRVNHLHKYFNYHKKNEIHVLNDVSVEFPNKGLVILLGASGSGKTTLLNVISGLDKVNKGTIEFDEVVLDKYKPKKWDLIRNERIGYIFQNYNLLPNLSVFDNVALVLKMMGINDQDIIEQRVNYILNAVNMYQFRKKRGLQLSGGQQQRVAIARALVKNPSVIIADEPTGNLDSKNTMEIMNIIKEISKQKLVILVTHERELAHFYGDRIIEIRDGAIIKDYQNENTDDYQFNHGDVIYLKDLNKINEVENEKIKISFYSDEVDDNPLSVRLILKNKTLYIDVDSPHKKQKLIDENTGVIIKDEHFVKKTREEITETAFDVEVLNNDKVIREKPILLSIKQSFSMAFRKILQTSRKAKLMMFSFVVAGVIVAFAIAILANAITIRPEVRMNISKGNVLVYSESYDKSLHEIITYDELLELGKNDNTFYINPYNYYNYNYFTFLNSDGSLSNFSFNGQYEPYDLITKKDLIAGRLPTKNTEILISKSIADGFIRYNGQEFGVWNYEHLFKESLDFRLAKGKIVGIVDSDIKIIYMDKSFITLKENPYVSFVSSDFAPTELLSGRLPKDGEGLIPHTFDELLTEEQREDLGYKISGVYFDENNLNIIFRTTKDIEKLMYEHSSNVYVRTNNPSKLVKDLKSLNLKAVDVYQDAYENVKQEQQVIILTTISTTAILLGIALLGFYFLMRSSLISRIYEISIFRALGMRKQNIFRSFIVEIVVITTITTLIGYLLTTIGLYKAQKGMDVVDQIFYVNTLSVVLGIAVAYGLNIIAGLFPVYFLLRKTPAQILTQYDI